MGQLLALDDGHFFGKVRISQAQAHQEPVQFRLGKGESALIFDWVLGGHHHEGRRQNVGNPVHRNLQFFHGLQQCRLGLGRCTVYFVGQNHLGHDGAGPEVEIAALLVIDGNARYVAG